MRKMPLVAVRSRSRTRFRLFFAISLPLVISETANGGLVWESEHGDAGHTVADAARFSWWRVGSAKPLGLRGPFDLLATSRSKERTLCRGSLGELLGWGHALLG